MIATEIIFIILLIVANGIFSGSEMAIVSARKVRLEQLASRGNRKARAALNLANAPNNFLSTVQIGITLIGILSGAVAGATLADRLTVIFGEIPALKPYSEGLSVAIVVTIITFLSLVIGELVPKRIALNNPEAIACAVAKPMKALSRLGAPLVYLLSISTDFLLKLFGIRISEEPAVTEEEIKVMIRQGAELGVFEEYEHKIVERVFRFGDRSVKSLMTPRTEIVWLDIESPLAENLTKVIDSAYSRFPVGRGSLDDYIGVLRGSSLLAARLSSESFDLESLIQQPLYIAENTDGLNVLEQFKETGIHTALVIDEYGGVEGLVTLNDLVEAILGELPSAENRDDPMAVQREDGSWLLDGLLDINELREIFSEVNLPEMVSQDYHSLGGFMMYNLKHIPRVSENFELGGLRFEVVDMDGTRVDKVLVTLVNNNPSQEISDDE